MKKVTFVVLILFFGCFLRGTSSASSADRSCENDCNELQKKGQLKDGITLQKCIEKLCGKEPVTEAGDRWGSKPLKAMPAATIKESQDFLSAKKTADAHAYQKFIQAHPGSALMSVFEDEMEFGGMIASPGDDKWERWQYLKPKHGNGEKLLLTTDEAAKWGLITVINGLILGGPIPGKITVYAKPSSLVTSLKEKCWRILAIKK